jgi:hypothetical protein
VKARCPPHLPTRGGDGDLNLDWSSASRRHLDLPASSFVAASAARSRPRKRRGMEEAAGSASPWRGDGVVRVLPSQAIAARRRQCGRTRDRGRRVGRLEVQCCGEERDSPGMRQPSAGIAKTRCRRSIRYRSYTTVLFCKMQMQMLIHQLLETVLLNKYLIKLNYSFLQITICLLFSFKFDRSFINTKYICCGLFINKSY